MAAGVSNGGRGGTGRAGGVVASGALGDATLRLNSLNSTPRRLAPISSPGQRALQRVLEKNKELAGELRKERNLRLHDILSKAPPSEGSSAPRVASVEQMRYFSELMNKRLVDLFIDPAERCWYKFFVHMDDDCSGKINYEELVDMIRNELGIKQAALSELDLQAVWRALDEDRSGLITAGEFGRFMRLGDHVHAQREPGRERRRKFVEEAAAAVRTQRDEIVAELDRRRAHEQQERRQRASDVYNSLWGGASTLSGGSLSSVWSTGTPWRSPRAHVF